MCSKWLGFPGFSLVPLMDCWVDGLGLAVRICRAAGESSNGITTEMNIKLTKSLGLWNTPPGIKLKLQ
jgi:hypothetical protein